MSNAPSGNSNLAQRLAEEIGRDKKKTAMLAGLALVGIVVAFRAMNKGPRPAPVMASDAGLIAETSDAMAVGLGAQGPFVSTLDEVYLQSIDHDINRDLFEFHSDFYTPLDPGVAEAVAEDNGTGGGGDEPAVDWQKVILGQSEALDLQSTIDSEIPIAIINGLVVGHGDVIDGFKILDLRSGVCVIEKKGVRVTLTMAH